MCYVIAKGNSNKIINISDNIVLKRPKKKNKKNLEIIRNEFSNHKKIYNLWKKNKKLFSIIWVPKPIKFIDKKGYLMEKILGDKLDIDLKNKKEFYEKSITGFTIMNNLSHDFLKQLLIELGYLIAICNIDGKIVTWDCELILSNNHVAFIDFDKIGHILNFEKNECKISTYQKLFKIQDSFVENYYPDSEFPFYNYFKNAYNSYLSKKGI